MFEFEYEEVSQQISRVVVQHIRSELTNIGRMDILERMAMDSLLKEQGRSLDECTEEGCAVEMGQMLDAELVLLGSISKGGELYSLSARLVDLETGKHLANKTLSFKADDETIIVTNARQIAAMLSSALELTAEIAQTNGNTIFIDAGTGLVTEQQRFLVKRKGEAIVNPSTGDFLGFDEIEIGEIEITSIMGEALAKCKPISGSDFQVGDFIKIGGEVQPVIPEMGQYSQPSQGTTPQRQQVRKSYGSIAINSDPQGSTVILDGDVLGETPLTKSDIEAGDHNLMIHKDGYNDFIQMVTIPVGRSLPVTAKLVMMSGNLLIKSDPVGAWITFDGKARGEATRDGISLKMLQVGRYKVKGELEHYYPAEQTVDIDFNLTKPITLTLKPMPGAIFASSTPSGADILIDGKPTGVKTPGKVANVDASNHTVILRLSGYHDKSVTVTVEPDKTAMHTETLEKVIAVEQRISSGGGQKVSGSLTGMEFVRIPGGSFQMGSNDGESDEKPIHRVTISPFYIMTTEVTQKMWKDIMGSNPSNFKGDNLPVETISWNDIQEFLKKLNQRDPGKGYRLPTEAEWEYSCRAGTTTKYHSGDSGSDLGRVGWYEGNSNSKTHPVGQKVPNSFGLYDMHGNVWEWCQDWKGTYPSSSVTDPKGPSTGSYRVFRGGSWYFSARNCRSANRDLYVPSFRSDYLGFRLARSL